jgi:hypothetical protein
LILAISRIVSYALHIILWEEEEKLESGCPMNLSPSPKIILVHMPGSSSYGLNFSGKGLPSVEHFKGQIFVMFSKEIQI